MVEFFNSLVLVQNLHEVIGSADTCNNLLSMSTGHLGCRQPSMSVDMHFSRVGVMQLAQSVDRPTSVWSLGDFQVGFRVHF